MIPAPRLSLPATALALSMIAVACSSSTHQEAATAATADSDPSATVEHPIAPGGPTTSEAATVSDDPAAGDHSPGGAGTGQTPAAAPAPDTAPLPATGEQLADELSRAELALRRPEAGDDSERLLTAAWGRRQQRLYRILAANGDWAGPVLAAVDPAVASAVEANWRAQQELASLVLHDDLSPTLPAWRIDSPRAADELLGYYHEAAEITGVPWEILAAINLVETRMGRIHGVSTAGAVGPMQFLPSTWSGCCEGDPADDRDAIIGAGTYLVRRGAHDDIARALRGYNNSDHYVQAVQAYASVLAADEQVYYGYHAWDVYFWSAAGLALLPVGYESLEPIDAASWLAEHPESLITPPDGG